MSKPASPLWQIGGVVSAADARVRSFTESFPARRTRVRAELAGDPTTAVLVALLVGAWCIAGVLDLTGLPHGLVMLVDLSEVVLCVWLGARLVFAREIPRSTVLVVVYALFVLTGLVTHASPPAVVVALSHWLVLPALAFFVAARGTSERRAIVVVATLLALGVFEFLLTVAQSFGTGNPDAIVGSFGTFGSAVTATVVLIVACVAVAGYLIRAPFGTLGLASAAILPLFSAWAQVKIVPVFLPVVTLAVVVPALVLRQTSWRRGAASMAAVMASAGLVLAFYAVFHPYSFKVLTSLSYAQRYDATPSLPPGSEGSQLSGVVLSNYGNASLSLEDLSESGSGGFKVANVSAGNYTVWMAGQGGAAFRVTKDRSYFFSASVKSLSAASQTIEPQIDWQGSNGHVIATISGRPLSSFGVGRTLLVLAVSGKAPAGAVIALPKIAVVNNPPAGSAILAESLRFERGSVRSQPSEVVLGNYGNASLSPVDLPEPGSVGFKVANVAAGNYTVWMAGQGGAPIRVTKDRSYFFSASVKSLSAASQTIEPQIDWQGSNGHVIATISGRSLSSFGVGRTLLVLTVSGKAPAGAVIALPKIAVVSNPPAGSAILAESLRFKRGTARNVPLPGSTHKGTGRAGQKPVKPRSTHKGTGRAGQKPVSPAPRPVPTPQLTPAPRPVFGRVTQWRMAEHAISGSLTAELFGNGLGSATVAVNLGVDKQDISADAEAASYSDFGTLLVERGWTGVAIVAFFALAIAGTAFRIARALPRGRWTTALTLAVPSVVAVMAVYGMMASNLRGRPAALTFWLVVALGLSPGEFLGGRPWRRASETSASSSAPPTGTE